MNKKQTLAIFLVIVMVAVPVASIGALASGTAAFDGQASNTDAADGANNTTILTVGNPNGFENVTIQMTEDHTIADAGSLLFHTNETVASAEVAASSGSGTATASVASNGTAVWVNETGGGANSVTLSTLNVTFNISDDGINVSEVTDNASRLVQDNDNSEIHRYMVIDRYMEVDYQVNGPAGGELNTSEDEYQPNATGHVQFVFDLTRNQTAYENESPTGVNHPQTLKYTVEVNTTVFANIEEKTNEDVDRIVLEDVKSQDGMKVYTWAIQNVNNTTTEHWDPITVKINATVMSGEENATLVETETHDPLGGTEADHSNEFDHAAGAGVVTGPQFFDSPVTTAIGIIVGLLVVGAIVWFLRRDRNSSMGAYGYAAYAGGWMMWAWIALLLVGLSMVGDFLLGSFNFWSNMLVTGVGLPDITPLIAGIALVVIALGLNARNSR